MGFQQRAVDTCVKCMLGGLVSERQVRDVLTCKDVDVSGFEQFLTDGNPMVREAAVRIIGEKGSAEKLLDIALQETERFVLFSILEQLGRRKCMVQPLRQMLDEKDSITREAVLNMFRRAGHTDELFPLLFSEDEALAQRIKGWLEHDDQQSETTG